MKYVGELSKNVTRQFLVACLCVCSFLLLLFPLRVPSPLTFVGIRLRSYFVVNSAPMRYAGFTEHQVLANYFVVDFCACQL